jgi:low affinity Fe/Cu permease
MALTRMRAESLRTLTEQSQQEAGSTMNELFQKVAQKTSRAAGSSSAFALAAGVVIVWGVTGPLFGYSDTWQLVINTGTTIITFLMVFLIQNSQNRDTRAVHLKLDELLRAIEGARQDLFVDLEDATEKVLNETKRDIEQACHPDESPEEHAKHAAAA